MQDMGAGACYTKGDYLRAPISCVLLSLTVDSLSRAFFKQWKFNVFLIRSRFNLFSDYLKTVFTGRFNLISLYNILKIWREKNYIFETLRHVLYVFWDWNNAVGCMDIEYFVCVQYKPITLPPCWERERVREEKRERNINMTLCAS